ncbi:MAG: HAD family hydrolase [Desulfobulbaceae bacterium]|nr:HAD family hydrolase [Desulfobulbaceae bacterium]
MKVLLRLPEVLPVRVVIFDIYGTMLISAAGDVGSDSGEASEDAFRAACRDGGVAKGDISQWWSGAEMLLGEIVKDRTTKKKQGKEYPEVDILEIWGKVLQQIYGVSIGEEQLQRCSLSYECRTNPTWPMPGLAETIAGLGRRDLLLGIISNAQFYTPLLFQAFFSQDIYGLGFSSRYCIWSYREGKGKPDLKLFSRLGARLAHDGVSPSEILYVGNDMLNDIMPASIQGWRTALFAGDQRSLRLRSDDPRVQGVEPDYVINDLRQLLV